MGLYGYLSIAGIVAVIAAFVWGFFYGKKLAKGSLEKHYLQGYADSQECWEAEKLAIYKRLACGLEPLKPVKEGARIVD